MNCFSDLNQQLGGRGGGGEQRRNMKEEKEKENIFNFKKNQ